MACNDRRRCFGRGEYGGCLILKKTYKNGECTFCKPEREWTKGKYFPVDPNYEKKGFPINDEA